MTEGRIALHPSLYVYALVLPGAARPNAHPKCAVLPMCQPGSTPSLEVEASRRVDGRRKPTTCNGQLLEGPYSMNTTAQLIAEARGRIEHLSPSTVEAERDSGDIVRVDLR